MSARLLDLFGTFGIEHSNRSPGDHWSKGCFNTSFPAALAYYFMKKDIKAIYNKLEFHNGQPKVVSSEIDIKDVFCCNGIDTSNLYFCFNSVFEKYQMYSYDQIKKIDLIVMTTDGQCLAPLKIELSVLRTNLSGFKSELPLSITSATTSYCALSMYDAVKNESKNVQNIFENACAAISYWCTEYEVVRGLPKIVHQINVFQEKYHINQKPLLIQAIWKTDEKTLALSDAAFDILVWSDYALSRLFIDHSYTPGKVISTFERTLSRSGRATARLARCLWELSKAGKIELSDIYNEMSYGNHSENEFVARINEGGAYLPVNRITTPILKKDALGEIIKPGYVERLESERRFDWSCFIEYERLFEERIQQSKLGKEGFCRKKCSEYLSRIGKGKASKLCNLLGFGPEVVTRFKNKSDGLKGCIPHKKRVIALAIGIGLSDYERFEFIRCSENEYPSEKLDIQVESIIRSGIKNFKMINEKLCEIDPGNDLTAPLKKET